MSLKTFYLIAGIILLPLFSVKSQEYLYDVGVSLGTSTAYGDLNARRLFYSPGFALEAHGRYIYNNRWSFVGELSYAGLSGDSRDFSNQFPEDFEYQFNHGLYQLALRAEFHFFNYGIGPAYAQLRRCSPYISAGLGFGVVSAPDPVFSFSIPVGFGVKYKINPRLGVGVRLDFAKQMTDLADGLKDANHITSGFAKNTDWYSVLNFSISYQFGKRKVPCYNDHY